MTESLHDALLTLGDWVRWATSQFTYHKLYFGHGTDNAWDEASLLVSSTLHLPWQHLQAAWGCHLTATEKRELDMRIQRRINERIPLAYLTGEAWFASLCFDVTPDVLIPRSPIAELIAQDFHPWLPHEPERILDMCTGSGCIGIACALQFDHASVVLTDISAKALSVAEKNIVRHSLADRVSVCESDVFEGLLGLPPEQQQFDLIVTNPPYVDQHDLDTMPPEYHHEPRLGLAAGHDGLDIVRRIFSKAHDFLSPQGILVLEVGNSWPALEAAFPNTEFLWPEFEHGGHGVCILHRDQLKNILTALT